MVIAEEKLSFVYLCLFASLFCCLFSPGTKTQVISCSEERRETK